MRHLVSIIMPAYNAVDYIAQSIESIVAQSFPDWELIVIDDGSTDGTAAVVRQIASTDKRIHLVTQPNGGQGRARNAGLRVAQGDLVAFLDADDLWVPDKLQQQIAVLDREQVDLVFSDGWIFPEDATEDESRTFGTLDGRITGAEMFRLEFIENRIPILSVLARREALARVNFFDEDRRIQNCEDYDLWMRLAEAGATFYSMSEKLVRYRQRAASVSRHARDQRMVAALAGENARTLQAKITLLDKHHHKGVVSPHEAEERFRGLYLNLISALLVEDRIEEARKCAVQLAVYAPRSWKIIMQQLLVRYIPRSYNHIRFWFIRLSSALRRPAVPRRLLMN